MGQEAMITFRTEKEQKERMAKGHCKGCYGCKQPCGKAKPNKGCQHQKVIKTKNWDYCIECNRSLPLVNIPD